MVNRVTFVGFRGSDRPPWIRPCPRTVTRRSSTGGLDVSAGGLTFVQGGLTFKFDKTSTNL